MKKNALLSLALLILTLWSCQQDEILNQSTSNVIEPAANSNDKHICLEKYPALLNGEVNKGSILQQYRWTSGETVRVKFLNGDSYLQQKVKQFASEWMSYANINFVFVPTDQNSDIKINFDNSNASWSYYGNYCQNLGQYQASMNFGWFNAYTSDSEFSRTTIHEFGHALGMVHEHQNPNVTIPWNRPAVYAYFSGSPNYWSASEVDSNILNTFSPSETNSGVYDKASIMHYFFPDGLTTDGSTFTQNNILSPTDKSFIGQVYPFPQIKSILNPGEILYANQSITSPNGQYTLIMQTDGNLVIYRIGGIPIWSSNTNTGINCYCAMQTDGNLVIYDYYGNYYWASNTAGMNGSILIMQDDGNLVTYLNGIAKWSWMSGRLY